MSKIMDIAVQIRGVSYKPNDLRDSLTNDSVIILRANNIDNDQVNYDDVVYVDKSKVKDYQYLQKGDILICASSGSKNLVGKAAIISENIQATFGAFCKVIRPKTISPEYLGLYFLSPTYREKISQLAEGVNINNIRNEHIDSLELAIPDEKTQSDVVNKLNRLFSVIHLQKTQLKKLDELIKSRFVEMFGEWSINPYKYDIEALEKHIDVLSGFPFDSALYVEDGINICGGLIIMPHQIKWNECKHWKTTSGYEDYMLCMNDIVMALDRPWIGEGFKIAKIDKTHLPALLIQRTARIRAIDINQEYLYYCFDNCGFENHCNITGSLVPHISLKDIKSFEIMIPPKNLQNQFADFVAKVEQQKATVQKSIDKLETLKKSLMQEYFG